MTANKKIFFWRTNEEWYNTYTNNRGKIKIKLTEKAPKEAKESLKAYYRYIIIRKLLGVW
ncbi:MAG: hypothetical protein LUG12_05660 [Erysipelotrichaceae bacterium]|nr:hypothetical protein [Erysipelotrichaceae bacterium]